MGLGKEEVDDGLRGIITSEGAVGIERDGDREVFRGIVDEAGSLAFDGSAVVWQRSASYRSVQGFLGGPCSWNCIKGSTGAYSAEGERRFRDRDR
jgi:hypothetical protein